MTIPLSPPRRYTTSKQLIGGDDFNNLNDHSFSFQQIAAPGANAQATATQVNAANVEFLAAAAAGAALFPVSYPGAEVCVLNNSANSQQLYGQGTDVIQSGAATYAPFATGVTLVTLQSAIFFCIKKGFWQRSANA